MMHSFFSLASLVALTTVVSAASGPAKRYTGAQVVRVAAGNLTQVTSIDNIISRLGLDTWASASATNPFFDIVLPPIHATQFSSEVLQLGVPITVMHADLEESILKESEVSLSKSVQARALVDDTWFDAYHSYADHMSYIDELAAMFPDSAKTFTIGTSVEDRQITGINIFGSSGSGTKPAVIFFGTMHGREWITTTTTEYLAYNLLTNVTAERYLEKFDFYIIPIVNPDGFVYTQTSDRMWRTNRSFNSSNSGCVGTDLNRNFPYKWGAEGEKFADPCVETYRGRAPGDTPEVAAMTKFLTSKGLSTVGARLFIDFHSYGDLFLTPYGWTDAIPSSYIQLESVADGFGKAFTATHGTRIRTGSSAMTLYPASGNAMDYAFDIARVPYSYTSILRDDGRYGFVLPASHIVLSGEETYAGVAYLLENL